MASYGQSRLGGCGVLVGLAILGAIGYGIYMGVVSMLHGAAMGPFKSHIAEYVATPKGPLEGDGTSQAKGKMLVLDTKTQEIDWDVNGDLPVDLKASKPEDVGTVVLVAWDKERKENYEYEGGSPAYYQTCDVTVIDQASRTQIGKNHFKGGEPPGEIGEHDSEGVGPKPTAEVVSYLKGLSVSTK